jgi:putative ABC transport system permease protein
MGGFLKLAFRNLMRHKRRSILTGFMIAMGALTMFLAFSFSRTVEKVMTDSTVKSYAGNIQIHAASREPIDLFYPAPDEVPFIPDTQRILQIIRSHNSVAAVAPRLRFGGLAAPDDKTPSEVVVTAIDPVLEPQVTSRIKVVQGNYLTRKDGIILGKTMAKGLKVELGQELILITSNQDGYLNGYPLVVEGIITHDGIGMFVDYMSYIDIDMARKLLYIGNDETYEFAVTVKDGIDESKVIGSLRQELTKEGFHLQVNSWRKVMGIINGIIMGIKVIPQVMLLILLLVISMGIINTVTMSVLERTREIGTMAALGTRRNQILGMFLWETGILSAISAGIGVLAGTGIVLWLGHTGIPVTVEAMEFFCGGERFYFMFSETGLLFSFLSIVCISVLAAYFPARTSTRLQPVEALRQN